MDMKLHPIVGRVWHRRNAPQVLWLVRYADAHSTLRGLLIESNGQ
jgi:hypothetical protein